MNGDIMLQFREIREDNVHVKVEPIGKDDGVLPKGFLIVYTDDELNEESVPELLDKLDEHDFGGDAEYTNFMIYFDDLLGVYKIEMDVSYFMYKDDPVPEIDEFKNFIALVRRLYKKKSYL